MQSIEPQTQQAPSRDGLAMIEDAALGFGAGNPGAPHRGPAMMGYGGVGDEPATAPGLADPAVGLAVRHHLDDTARQTVASVSRPTTAG